MRDKAFKTLRRWLEGRCQDLTHDDYLRLWKALFYCMWMADKPSYQQSLARRFGDIWIDLHRVAPSAGILYAEAFWETISREWSGLDRLRLDKFYFLVKRFYLAGFETMAESGWSLEQIKNVGKVLLKWPLGIRRDVPDALRIHLLENFGTIFKNSGKLTAEQTEELMRPYVELISVTDKKPVQAVAEGFFKRLVDLSEYLDCKAIASQTLSIGEGAEVKGNNRAILYTATQLLQKASK